MGQTRSACSWHAGSLLSSENLEASGEGSRAPEGPGLLGMVPQKREATPLSDSVPHALSPALMSPLTPASKAQLSLRKSLTRSEPQFPHLEKGGKNSVSPYPVALRIQLEKPCKKSRVAPGTWQVRKSKLLLTQPHRSRHIY